MVCQGRLACHNWIVVHSRQVGAGEGAAVTVGEDVPFELLDFLLFLLRDALGPFLLLLWLFFFDPFPLGSSDSNDLRV